MGEAGAGLADDVGAIHWNPAGLAFLGGQEISITHSNWLPQFGQSDLFYEYLNYRNHIESIGGTIGASVTYLNLGEFTITGEGGPEPLGTFKAFEFAVTAGYSTKLMDNLGVGLNLRYIHSSLANFDVQGQGRKGVGTSVSFDLAALYKPQMFGSRDRLGIGLNLSNLGPKVTYIDAAQADPLPTNLRLGVSFKVLKTEFNNITLNTDFSRILVRRYPAGTSDPFYKGIFTAWGDRGLKKVTIGAGVEYWYGNPRLLALRYGYFYEHPEAGNRKFHTFGAGIRYDVYGFDFSYLSTVEENHPLAETLRFTLLLSWGGGEEE
jgi:opacity protein-like surface antigen